MVNQKHITERVKAHLKKRVVSSEYFLENTFTLKELNAIADIKEIDIRSMQAEVVVDSFDVNKKPQKTYADYLKDAGIKHTKSRYA